MKNNIKDTMDSIQKTFLAELSKSKDASMSQSQAEKLMPFGIAWLVMNELVEETEETKEEGKDDIKDELKGAEKKYEQYEKMHDVRLLDAADKEADHAALYMELYNDYSMKTWHDEIKAKIKRAYGSNNDMQKNKHTMI